MILRLLATIFNLALATRGSIYHEAEKFQLLSPEEFKEIKPEAISHISFEQFNQLSSAAKLEMTIEQARAFPMASAKALIPRHPCEAAVRDQDSFRPAVLEILKKRCSAYFKKDSEIIFSSQIMASMFVLSLIFFITS